MTPTAPTTLPSIFTPPPIPIQAQYSFALLNGFVAYSRETYNTAALAAGLPQAPDADPTRVEQDWWDTSPAVITAGPTDLITYNIAEPGIGQFTTQSLPAAQVRTPNFPGARTFPAYIVLPSNATLAVAGGQPQLFNPNMLSTMDQAVALAAQWKIANPVITQVTAGYSANGETRGIFQIEVNGQPFNVGLALYDQNGPKTGPVFSGVGNPGSWLNYAWQPAPLPAGVCAPGAAYPIPCRLLISPPESVVSVGIGQFVIENENFASAAPQTDNQSRWVRQALMVLLNALPGGNPLGPIPTS